MLCEYVFAMKRTEVPLGAVNVASFFCLFYDSCQKYQAFQCENFSGVYSENEAFCYPKHLNVN